MNVEPLDDGRDRVLLERLAAGQPGALAELYDIHADRLFGHALALTQNRADAEDLVQATFLKIAALGTVASGIRHPARYLHQAIRGAAIDLSRRRATRRDAAADLAAAMAPSSGAALEIVSLDVRQALAGLPAEQREVVVLHLVEGFSFREIGRATGVATFTAASRYRLALARMRRALGSSP
jgi:RNA polymerase sigma-70 factor (ECF subfamily)